MTKSTSKVAIVRDVEFHWANVIKPVSPFGAEQWDVQIRTVDLKKAAELTELGINMKKHDEGYLYANVKRKTKTNKGEAQKPPIVIDANMQPLSDSIGNGSKGHIKVFSYEYNVQGRSGRSAMLSAIQVIDLIPYGGSSGGDEDFTVEGGDADFS